jgi:hypothetical protein
MCRFQSCLAGAQFPPPGDCSRPTLALRTPPGRGRQPACHFVVVVVVDELVDGVTLEPLPVEVPEPPPVVEPDAPMVELELPDVSLLLVEPGVVPLLLLVEPGVVPLLLVEPGEVPLPVLLEPGVVVPPLLLPPIALVLPVPLLPGVLVLLLEVDVSGAGLVVVVDELDELVVGVPV